MSCILWGLSWAILWLWSTLTTLGLHHLSISTLLYVLGNRALHLLNLGLVVWTTDIRFVDLLL